MNADEIYDKIKEINIIKADPDDVICIKCNRHLAASDVLCIKDIVQPFFPDNRIFFIDKNLDIEIIRNKKSEESKEAIIKAD